ncbi:MAG TPA: hypothetical protein VK113_04730 [Gemmatimonadales bacterium]|nr:hypothetical protein [Gemmatimonadales bacterium]
MLRPQQAPRVGAREQEEAAAQAVAAARAPSKAQALELEVRRTASQDELVPPVEQASRGGSVARQVAPSPDAPGAGAVGAAGATEVEWVRTQLGGAPRRQRPRRRGSPRRRCCRHCSARASLPRGPLPGPLGTPFHTTGR